MGKKNQTRDTNCYLEIEDGGQYMHTKVNSVPTNLITYAIGQYLERPNLPKEKHQEREII